jgi:PhoPQ-activated pathogenicity-related protein
MTHLRLLLLCVCLLSGLSSGYAYDLLTYVAAPDASFTWQTSEEKAYPYGTMVTFDMTSQTWHDIPWRHQIVLFTPANCTQQDIAVLVVTGGNKGKDLNTILLPISLLAKCPVAVLYNIPVQPLFERKEDDLIAYTYDKALVTGDLSWALLLPMTKSALRAMDVIQAYSTEQMAAPITRFVVGGASKRGWTTWLTAAADPERVKGIVPIVYDNLDLPRQMQHQLDCYGEFSAQIKPYTDLRIQERMQTETGMQLTRLVDPMTYVERITMPKLIINGTNDPYWTVDALNLYWDGLAGEKAVLYVPNGGHDLGLGKSKAAGALEIINAIATLVDAVATHRSLPKMTWAYTVTAQECTLTLAAEQMQRARLWVATSATFDFRQSTWQAYDMAPADGGVRNSVPLPTEGYLAMYGEATFTGGLATYALSTQMKVLSPEGAVE